MRVTVEEAGPEWQVYLYLNGNTQCFPVGPRWLDEADADWYAKQLRKALATVGGKS